MTRVALVTGGQQGIGLGIARQLAQAGFHVAVASRSTADTEAVRTALGDLGNTARYFRHDVSDIDHIPVLLDAIEAEMGPVTTLVNNAGVGAPVRGDLLDLLPENWDFVQNINLRGAFFLAQGVARRMLTQPTDGYRSIIFVTSVSATMVSSERAEYCVSKAGASMMSELFAVRLAPHDIGVFELRPGIISTEMTAGVRDKYTSRIEGGLVPAMRWGEPQDIGEIAVSMATGQMRFANGAAIPVDGGLSIPRL
ncbi:3-ketoacyl-ACP reductase [Ruegeria sp. HKCCD8929]|uniref:3-ketoacyl-ACP reductase n=1 Tax=Ruegeria sp. HKCCD8929 TaxID=2683006 RepID=UPI001489849B|nr:3-ketoacyl-ACP reductase [Ruegeria sp. HKCCD8929]